MKTGSQRAYQILELWEQYLPMFVKIVPVDYRRALKDLQNSKLDSTAPTDNIMAGE
jgi:glutamate synthase (NADPH/NADH) large chain